MGSLSRRIETDDWYEHESEYEYRRIVKVHNSGIVMLETKYFYYTDKLK